MFLIFECQDCKIAISRDKIIAIEEDDKAITVKAVEGKIYRFEKESLKSCYESVLLKQGIFGVN